jgi:hypothetical protein
MATTLALAEEEAAKLQAIADRIRNRQQRVVEDIIEIGRDLIAAKAALGHGHFGPWLDQELRMTVRSAQRYIAVAAQFGDKCDTVSYLPPTILYRLAAPSAPKEAVHAILSRLERGERPTPEALAAELTKDRVPPERKAVDVAKAAADVEELRRQRAALSAHVKEQDQDIAKLTNERLFQDAEIDRLKAEIETLRGGGRSPSQVDASMASLLLTPDREELLLRLLRLDSIEDLEELERDPELLEDHVRDRLIGISAVEGAERIMLALFEHADEEGNPNTGPGTGLGSPDFLEWKKNLPRFMGMDPFEWKHAPDALVAHFDLTRIIGVWRRDWDEWLVSRGRPALPEFDRGELYQMAEERLRLQREEEERRREEAERSAQSSRRRRKATEAA